MIEREQWRTLKYLGEEYEKYEISNIGRVRNGNKIRKEIISLNGYPEVKLGGDYKKGSPERYKIERIHKLVAMTWISNPDSYPEIDHIDSNKLNNTIDNLQWCDRKFNIRKNVNHIPGRLSPYRDLYPEIDRLLPLNGFNQKQVSELLNIRWAVVHRRYLKIKENLNHEYKNE